MTEDELRQRLAQHGYRLIVTPPDNYVIFQEAGVSGFWNVATAQRGRATQPAIAKDCILSRKEAEDFLTKLEAAARPRGFI
jgi:hypothetical protein